MKLEQAKNHLRRHGASTSWLNRLNILMSTLDTDHPGSGHPREYNHDKLEGLIAFLECQRLLGDNYGPTSQSSAPELYDLISNAPCTPSYAVKWGGTPWRLTLEISQTIEHAMRGLGVCVVPVHQFCETENS